MLATHTGTKVSVVAMSNFARASVLIGSVGVELEPIAIRIPFCSVAFLRGLTQAWAVSRPAWKQFTISFLCERPGTGSDQMVIKIGHPKTFLMSRRTPGATK